MIKATTNLACKSCNFLIYNEGPRKAGQPQGEHAPPHSLSLWPQKFMATGVSERSVHEGIIAYSPRHFLNWLSWVSSLSQEDCNMCKTRSDCFLFILVPSRVLWQFSCLVPLPYSKRWEGGRKHAHWFGHSRFPGPPALQTRLQITQKPWCFCESHIYQALQSLPWEQSKCRPCNHEGTHGEVVPSSRD